MRVRTLLVAALAGGLLVAGSWAVATAASEAGVPRRDGSVIARPDAAEAPALAAATGASERFDAKRDMRRVDAFALAAAFVVAVSVAWSIVRHRPVGRLRARASSSTRPRGPPRHSAFVGT